MATHSSILAWRIPWTEEPCGLQSSPWGHKELYMTEQLTLSLSELIKIKPSMALILTAKASPESPSLKKPACLHLSFPCSLFLIKASVSPLFLIVYTLATRASRLLKTGHTHSCLRAFAWDRFSARWLALLPDCHLVHPLTSSKSCIKCHLPSEVFLACLPSLSTSHRQM